MSNTHFFLTNAFPRPLHTLRDYADTVITIIKCISNCLDFLCI